MHSNEPNKNLEDDEESHYTDHMPHDKIIEGLDDPCSEVMLDD